MSTKKTNTNFQEPLEESDGKMGDSCKFQKMKRTGLWELIMEIREEKTTRRQLEESLERKREILGRKANLRESITDYENCIDH